MILQNISRRIVGNVLIIISPSNILPILLKPERFHQKYQADLAAVSIIGLRSHSALNISILSSSKVRLMCSTWRVLSFEWEWNGSTGIYDH